MENFKEQFRNLEMRILREIRNKIEASTIKSDFIVGNVIKIDEKSGLNSLFVSSEVALVNDRLTLIGASGLHQPIQNISLEYLIDLVA